VRQRFEDDADVARPHDQVSRLWVSYALKIFVSRIELERTRVGVLKTGVEIRLMNKM